MGTLKCPRVINNQSQFSLSILICNISPSNVICRSKNLPPGCGTPLARLSCGSPCLFNNNFCKIKNLLRLEFERIWIEFEFKEYWFRSNQIFRYDLDRRIRLDLRMWLDWLFSNLLRYICLKSRIIILNVFLFMQIS